MVAQLNIYPTKRTIGRRVHGLTGSIKAGGLDANPNQGGSDVLCKSRQRSDVSASCPGLSRKGLVTRYRFVEPYALAGIDKPGVNHLLLSATG